MKNFISIREALKLTSPRVMRLCYAYCGYDKILNFEIEKGFNFYVTIDKKVVNFFEIVN